MTPLPANIKSVWHMVALSRDIATGKKLALILAGTPVVLFATRLGWEL